MIMFAAVLVTLPTSGLGAPYPRANLEAAPEQQTCYVRYRFSTDATINEVASFYRAEAARSGVSLFDDSNTKFNDYRTLVFIAQPKFIDVVLDRKNGRTVGRVSYKMNGAATCR